MRSFLRTTFLISVFIAAPFFASADTLYLSPGSGSYSAGKTFTVRVYVSSLAQSINAVSGVVSYPQDKLQVVSVSKTDSILTLWTEEPSFSNSSGKVSFEGVVPNPGYTGSAGSVVTVNFKVVGQGSATVKFDSGSVLANDGSGTNILKNVGSASFSLGSSPVPTVVETPVVQTVEEADPNTPKAPVITSVDFPETKSWYSKTSGTFKWGAADDITASKLLVGKIPKSDPTVVYSPAITSKEITDLEDGVWYLHVQLKNKTGWGAVAHYAFKVDTTKPDSFTVKQTMTSDETNPRPRFAFSATDGMSGINHFSVQIDGAEPATWRDDGSGVYETPVLPPGKHTLVARAYDEADNYAVASVDFLISPIESPRIDSYTETVATEMPLSVSGTSLPNTTVYIKLKNDRLDPISLTAKTDSAGKFSVLYDKDIPRGSYRMTAIAEDKRGAQSEPSIEKIVTSKAAWLASLGSTVMNMLAIFVPIAALAFALIYMGVHVIHKIMRFRKSVRRELREIESTIEKAFDLLKEDVEDSIHLLEHAKSRRKLTEEEGKIIDRFRQNLSDAEKVIKKEIRDVEREIGDR
jgi:hypothetical protein